MKAIHYIILEHNKDGSIYYFGKIQNNFNPNHLDHYHTGFELRMLYSILKLINEINKRMLTKQGWYIYMIKNFFGFKS